MLNKIHLGHVLPLLKEIDDESVDSCITSPPYYGLRSYSTEPQIWLNGKESCENHEWITERIIKNGGKSKPDNPPSVGANASMMENDLRGKGIESLLCKNCGAYYGELGLEPTFELYLEHLWQIFDEIKRVLKKTGSCWVNIGDSYYGGKGKSGSRDAEFQEERFNRGESLNKKHQQIGGKNQTRPTDAKQTGMQAKTLMQIPSRFAIGMTDRNWILRNSIIWYKRNCMPSSAKDRFTVDYEMIYFFTKSQKYFFEQQFEPQSETTLDRFKNNVPRLIRTPKYINPDPLMNYGQSTGAQGILERGRNKRCVWDITPTPFSEAHFAVYPQELVLPMIKAGCPEFICNKCGKAREKIYESEGYHFPAKDKEDKQHLAGVAISSYKSGPDYAKFRQENPILFTGYTDCKCNAGFHPGVILDCFIGSGTTGIVARKLNRNYIGIELKEEYKIMAEKRIEEELGLFI